MSRITYEVKGANRVANKLRRLVKLTDTLEPVANAWGQDVRGQLKGLYSQVPPKPSYKRTGKFGSSWSFKGTGRRQWTFENSQDYSGFVMGFGQQAWMHQGQWPTDKEFIESKIPDLTRGLSDEIESIWGS